MARTVFVLMVMVALIYQAHGQEPFARDVSPHGQVEFARDVSLRIYSDVLMKVFDMAYTLSEPFGFGRKSIYFLSTYLMQYPQALESCKSLGGNLAEINNAAEFTFVTNFLRPNMLKGDQVFISGYRTSNSGSFISTNDVNILDQVLAFEEGRGVSKVNTDTTLFSYFQPNRPRFQGHLPSCLSIELRGTNLAMNNDRCAEGNNQRYLCEVVY